MSELFTGHVGPTGSVTATRAGRRWVILAIGMPSVNCTLACALADVGRPMRREKTR